MLDHLHFLYGEVAAPAVEARIRTLMAAHQAALADAKVPAPTAPPRAPLPLTARDALLITYGDQLREPGVPPLRSLAEFLEARARGVVSGVHLLPFYPYSSDDGFAVMDFQAVNPALGRWADIQRLSRSFDLMFDAVINHLSARGAWFQKFLAGDPAFRDFFVTVTGQPDLSEVIRPRTLPLLTEFATAAGPQKVWTTFSADQVDLNYRNPEVLLAVLAVLLCYARQGARFLRLDAIAFLWKEPGTTCLHLPPTHRVIQLLRAVLDAAAPHVLLITETNVPHRDNLTYFGDGANEAQLVYNFALPPLTLHTFQTGRAAALTRWAASLGPPSDQTAFFNFLASHDGIGLNPARGLLTEAEIEALVSRTLSHGGLISRKSNPDGSTSPYEMNISYFDALSDPCGFEPLTVQAGRFLAAHAIMLSLAGLPGIYFHSLFGSRGARSEADASGIPRRINRQRFRRREFERELDNPASLRARVFAGLKELLRIRGEHAAFAPTAPQTVLDAGPHIFAVLRQSRDGGDAMLCLHNVSAEGAHASLALPAGSWVDQVTWEKFAPVAGRLELRLAPYQIRWLARTHGL